MENQNSIKPHIDRIKNGVNVSVISNELNYGIANKQQLADLIALFIAGDEKTRTAINEFLTDINYHSFNKKLTDFSQFIDEYFNF